LVAHLHFANAQSKTEKCKRATKPTLTDKQNRKNNEGTTMCISNSGFGAKMKGNEY